MSGCRTSPSRAAATSVAHRSKSQRRGTGAIIGSIRAGSHTWPPSRTGGGSTPGLDRARSIRANPRVTGTGHAVSRRPRPRTRRSGGRRLQRPKHPCRRAGCRAGASSRPGSHSSSWSDRTTNSNDATAAIPCMIEAVIRLFGSVSPDPTAATMSIGIGDVRAISRIRSAVPSRDASSTIMTTAGRSDWARIDSIWLARNRAPSWVAMTTAVSAATSMWPEHTTRRFNGPAGPGRPGSSGAGSSGRARATSGRCTRGRARPSGRSPGSRRAVTCQRPVIPGFIDSRRRCQRS